MKKETRRPDGFVRSPAALKQKNLGVQGKKKTTGQKENSRGKCRLAW